MAAGAIAGCRDAGNAAPDATASTSAHPTVTASPDASPDASPGSASGAAGRAPCRIMAGEGGPPPGADTTAWLDLPGKSNVTVRTIETGRELRYEGPGRVRACSGDVALVAEGSAVGLPGSGEAPGGEQWVATACGVARWAAGVHRFSGARDACTLHSSTGSMNLYVASDMTAEEIVDGGAPLPVEAGAASAPWRRIDVRQSFLLKGRGPLDSATATKSALTACERAAANVQSLSAGLTAPEAGTNPGNLAAESVAARGIARAACAVAAVRVALGGSKSDDVARLDGASTRWRAPR